MNTSTNKKNKGIKWFAVGIIVILIVLGFCQRAFISAYITNFRENPYKPGDRINISGSAMERVSSGGIYRLTKNNPENAILSADIVISKDSLNKYKTTYIGEYIDYKLVPIAIDDRATGKKRNGLLLLYQFAPDLRVTQKCVPEQLPNGAAYADNHYYLIYADVLNFDKK